MNFAPPSSTHPSGTDPLKWRFRRLGLIKNPCIWLDKPLVCHLYRRAISTTHTEANPWRWWERRRKKRRLPNPVGRRAKTSFPPTKAFRAVLWCSFNETILGRLDNTDEIAASMLTLASSMRAAIVVWIKTVSRSLLHYVTSMKLPPCVLIG